MRIRIFLYAFLSVIWLTSCDQGNKDKKKTNNLLIFCGITMAHPMKEIAEIIEKKHDCKIKIIKDGSNNLYKSLVVNKVGDVYLPGSEYYMTKCVDKGIILGSPVLVGYNKAALIVAKGNPKKIRADLDELLNPSIRTVLCNPETGSIGRETQKILKEKGIQRGAYSKVLLLTTDSKDLTKALKNNNADLVINWKATAYWPENSKYETPLEIDEKYAKKKKLLLGVLKYSKHPEIARDFQKLAVSKEGKAIFAKYGFLKSDVER